LFKRAGLGYVGQRYSSAAKAEAADDASKKNHPFIDSNEIQNMAENTEECAKKVEYFYFGWSIIAYFAHDKSAQDARC